MSPREEPEGRDTDSGAARIAFEGGVAPQKPTDFCPKLLSGLTTYRVER